MQFTPEVEDALRENKPVVALESTVISHGLPNPDNLDVINDMYKVIKEEGAVPAIIAIRDGIIKVGLSTDDLNYFVDSINKPSILKVSRADISATVARKITGATTVSATMVIAAAAGIRVFATGGIGGAHMDAENSMDVSADLYEFAKSQVAVVASGAKSILDIHKTLEILETQGVPILGFGTDSFPIFYSSKSEHNLLHTFDNAADVARAIATQFEFGLGGVLIANPIPNEHSIEDKLINEWLKTAMQDLSKDSISGKQVTPYLLSKLREFSNNRTLDANKALLVNNAMVAAQVAAKL